MSVPQNECKPPISAWLAIDRANDRTIKNYPNIISGNQIFTSGLNFGHLLKLKTEHKQAGNKSFKSPPSSTLKHFCLNQSLPVSCSVPATFSPSWPSDSPTLLGGILWKPSIWRVTTPGAFGTPPIDEGENLVFVRETGSGHRRG